MRPHPNKGFETNDLKPVAIVAFSPDVIAVHPQSAKDLKEFLANAKTRATPMAARALAPVPISERNIFQ
jgi:tripartite-type tricarboxylate transporter receptor subunit TctC